MKKTVYGLPNCDSTKATIKFYKNNNQAFQLHDLRIDGITKDKLEAWLQKVPLEKLLNKKSTTWRSLAAAEQAKANTIAGATLLMLDNTNLIKRPVIESGGQLESVGVIPS